MPETNDKFQTWLEDASAFDIVDALKDRAREKLEEEFVGTRIWDDAFMKWVEPNLSDLTPEDFQERPWEES